MLNNYETGNEYCPKCGESWYGDCPNKPYWIEYYCENPECRYGVGEDFYTGDRMIIRDSDRDDMRELINQIRHLHD